MPCVIHTGVGHIDTMTACHHIFDSEKVLQLFLVLLMGLEPWVFGSRVRRSTPSVGEGFVGKAKRLRRVIIVWLNYIGNQELIGITITSISIIVNQPIIRFRGTVV